MEAIIMAGGEGSRLRPLTCDIPKPMARLCGKPIMEYIFELLQRNGFEKATLTLGYMANVIRNAYDEKKHGTLNLDFIEETTPLGTAGGVKNAAKGIDDDFLVISGDALCDFDLAALMKQHKQTGALITIGVTKVTDPREYGLVKFDEQNNVLGFNEKPSWSGVTTHWANTGIYAISPMALNMIPDGQPFDFANHLFPAMMAEEMALQVFCMDGYWCDIGDLHSYRRCQSDLVEGKVKGTTFPMVGDGIYGYLPKGRDYHLIPPVYLGQDVQIGQGAVIGPNAILDDGVQVGRYAKIRSSVLLRNGLIGDASRITGAVLCGGVGVGHQVSVYENAVLGSRVTVGDYAEIKPNVSVWPEKTIEAESMVLENLRIGEPKKEVFDDDGIVGRIGLDITPEFCARLGAAAGSMKKVSRIGVGCENTPAGKTMYHAFLAGACGTGAQVCDFGETTLAQMHFAAAFCGMQICVYINGSDPCTIHLIGSDGLPASRETERELEKILQRGEFVRCSAEQYRWVADVGSIKMLYLQEVSRLVPDGLTGIKATLVCEHRESERLLVDTFLRLGGATGGLPKFVLSKDGRRVTATDENHHPVSYGELLALGCLITFQNGEDVSLPYEAPYIINDLAKGYGCSCYRYFDLSDPTQKKIRAIARNQYWSRDGMMLVFMILNHMKKHKTTLAQIRREVPDVAQKNATYVLHHSPSVAMERLKTLTDTAQQGLQFVTNDKIVRIWPSKRGRALRILAEAHTTEAANELCEDWHEKIADLLDRNQEL